MISDHPDYNMWIHSYQEEYDTVIDNVIVMKSAEFTMEETKSYQTHPSHCMPLNGKT